MHLILSHLHHLALVIALVPGSLLFLVVALWRVARAVAGFKKPRLPLVTTEGSIIYTADDWHRDNKADFPIRYALFEELPRRLKLLGRNIVRPFRHKIAREVLLHHAFEIFRGWVESHQDFVYGSIYALDDDGPTQRLLARKWEMQALYHWWTEERPASVCKIEESHLDSREFFLVELEQDDEVHLARLANLWKDLI